MKALAIIILIILISLIFFAFSGMKGPSKGYLTLLATLLAVSLCSAVPILDKAPTRSLHDELYQAAKRSSHPQMTINESPPNDIDRQEWVVEEK